MTGAILRGSFGDLLPAHQMRFDAFDHERAALAFGIFQLVARLAELVFLLRFLGKQPVVTDGAPPFEVRPVAADGANGRDHCAAIHAGAKARLFGQRAERGDFLRFFQLPKELRYFRRSTRNHWGSPWDRDRSGFRSPKNRIQETFVRDLNQPEGLPQTERQISSGPLKSGTPRMSTRSQSWNNSKVIDPTSPSQALMSDPW